MSPVTERFINLKSYFNFTDEANESLDIDRATYCEYLDTQGFLDKFGEAALAMELTEQQLREKMDQLPKGPISRPFLEAKLPDWKTTWAMNFKDANHNMLSVSQWLSPYINGKRFLDDIDVDHLSAQFEADQKDNAVKGYDDRSKCRFRTDPIQIKDYCQNITSFTFQYYRKMKLVFDEARPVLQKGDRISLREAFRHLKEL